ncbi:MAG TPA: hypothetical protein VIE63_17725 [Ramlibacter sp.]|jgi:hypothetical protein
MQIAVKSAVAALALALAACASQPTDSAPKPPPSKLQEAAIAPLTDLNLVRAPIPLVLAAAQKAPYAPPPDATCAGLAAEIATFDAVLGADLDTPVTPANPSLVERGSDVAGDVAVSAVRSTAESIIPFRAWVRRLSGAEKYSKDVAAAITAGTVRRSFLKGLGDAAACGPPAAPKR